jgi:uncharacterized membrane protein YheB (UPF0754 family)
MISDKNLGRLGVLVGLVGVGYGLYVTNKMNKLAKKIDKTIDELSDDIEVDITDGLVHEALDKAVEREVGSTVQRAAASVTLEIKDNIRKQVKESVQSAYANIKSDVTKEVERQVGNIDISSIRDEIVEKGKRAAVEKLDSSLDDICDKFNNDLHNVSKIYESIASRMTGNTRNDKEMVFKIS